MTSWPDDKLSYTYSVMSTPLRSILVPSRTEIDTEELLLMTDVQPRPRQRWRRPALALEHLPRRLLLVTHRRRLDQRQPPVFTQHDQVSGRHQDRPAAEAGLLPEGLADFHVQARQRPRVVEAVDVAADADVAGEVCLQLVAAVHRPGLEGAARRLDLDQGATLAVARRDEHVVPFLVAAAGPEQQRRRRVDVELSLPGVPPEQLAVPSLEPNQTVPREEEHLPHAAEGRRDRGAIAGRVVQGLPGEGAGLGMKRGNRVAVRAARVGEHQAALDQRRKARPPAQIRG